MRVVLDRYAFPTASKVFTDGLLPALHRAKRTDVEVEQVVSRPKAIRCRHC
jgi:hypothetical protein